MTQISSRLSVFAILHPETAHMPTSTYLLLKIAAGSASTMPVEACSAEYCARHEKSVRLSRIIKGLPKQTCHEVGLKRTIQSGVGDGQS